MKLRVLHFGYTANLGGVEVFVSNMNKYFKNVIIDLVVSTNEKIPYEDEFLSKGSEIYRITPRKSNPVKYFFDIAKVIKQSNCDYVHANINSYSSIAAIVIGKLFGKKCIVHSHTSNKFGGKINDVLCCINRPLSNLFTDYRFACSSAAGDFMFKDKKYSVVKNGIDLDKFEFSQVSRVNLRNKLGADENTTVVGSVGHLTHIKNHTFLLDVFKQCLFNNPNMMLVIAGVGGEEQHLKEKCNNLKIADKVVFLGRIENVNEYLSAFDVFALPSLFEGFSFALIEAQANGLPCIASLDVPKQTNLTNNVSYLSIQDVDLWAKKILSFPVRLGENSSVKQIITDCGYDVNDTAEKLEEFYMEHINK